MKAFFVFLLIFSATLFAGNRDTLYVLQTTDIHGHIYPYNYFTDKVDEHGGLAKIYTRVVQYRKKHKNVILVDSGDLLQGTPLTYYFNHNARTLPDPMILAMNYMRYDAFAVGNHDIEQGPMVYLEARNKAEFPWLSANSVMEDGRPFFKPWTIIECDGIKIGIIGLTTPGIPLWLDHRLYPGITWVDMVTTARRYARRLRPKVDVLIGIFHAGFNAGYSKKQSDAAGIPNENASGLVAEQVPEFDAVFAGHSHHAGPMKVGRALAMVFPDGKTLRLNAGFWARNLGVAQFILENKKVVAKKAWLEPMLTVKADQAILQLTAGYHKKTLTYIREKIGEVTRPLSAKDSRFKDTPLIELINKAQMDYMGADIGFAASFNDRFSMPAGPLRIKDVYGMYKYENFLYLVKMTGQQIKDYLEFSARYYTWDGKQVGVRKGMPGFNYDMAEGINYEIDVRRPVGQRIRHLTMPDGSIFALNKTYKVAMNSYRAMGGGGHMQAAHAMHVPVLKKSTEEMRNVLIDYIRSRGRITPRVNNNWRIVK